MTTFSELPAARGVGPVHVNRFRTVIQPRPGLAMPSGEDLAANMPNFMDRDSASVAIDPGHLWAGRPTLMFRGVARVRPFAVPIPAFPSVGALPQLIGVSPERSVPVPPVLRNWMLPDINTDTVGLAAKPGRHAFTVLTLRRNYRTSDDHTVELLTRSAIISAVPVSALAQLIPPVRRKVLDPFVDLAVLVNQHHFLAGRRSFRMGTAKEYGLPGDHWVFETAAVERYSLDAYQVATDQVMGGAPLAVTPVWMQMGARLAAFYGRQVGPTIQDVAKPPSLAAAVQHPLYRSIAALHADLLP